MHYEILNSTLSRFLLLLGMVKRKLINFKENAAAIFKGQINSEWIYEIINFPKNEPKNLKGFLPYVSTIKTLRAEIL